MAEPTGLPIIDPVVIEDCYMNDFELLREVYDIFLSTYKQQVNDIGVNIAANDQAALRAAAHKVKGGLLNIGAADAAEAARRIESSAKEGRLDETPEQYAFLQERLAILLQEYDRYLSENS